MELIEFQEDFSSKEEFSQIPSEHRREKFWTKFVSEDKCPELKKVPVKLCTVF
jgi:hypothetical protein